MNQEEFADLIGDALSARLLPLAASVPRVAITAATPEQVELAELLARVRTLGGALFQDLMTGVPVTATRWRVALDTLRATEELCRRQLDLAGSVIDGDVVTEGPS
jgi:hypothetical protein